MDELFDVLDMTYAAAAQRTKPRKASNIFMGCTGVGKSLTLSLLREREIAEVVNDDGVEHLDWSTVELRACYDVNSNFALCDIALCDMPGLEEDRYGLLGDGQGRQFEVPDPARKRILVNNDLFAVTLPAAVRLGPHSCLDNFFDPTLPPSTKA